jgi:hypothetical protein
MSVEMDGWKPLEMVALVAVVAVTAVSLCALLAWYRLRHRQIELAACASDDQAARLSAEDNCVTSLVHVEECSMSNRNMFLALLFAVALVGTQLRGGELGHLAYETLV